MPDLIPQFPWVNPKAEFVSFKPVIKILQASKIQPIKIDNPLTIQPIVSIFSIS